MAKTTRLCLFATKKQIARLMKLPEIAELTVQVIDKVTAMQHEAALAEAAEVLRAAGMDGAVMVFLDEV